MYLQYVVGLPLSLLVFIQVSSSYTTILLLLLPPPPLLHYSVTAGGGRRGASAPSGTFQRGGHFKEDKKISAYVRSFKCFTALNIRPPEVFCMWRLKCTKFIFGRGSAPPHARELPTLSSQLEPRARRGGRTNVCSGRHVGCSVSVVVGRRTSDERSRVRFPAGALQGSLGQLSLPFLLGR